MKRQKIEWKKSKKLSSPSSLFADDNFDEDNISSSCPDNKLQKAISTTAEKNFLSNQFKNEGAELAAEEKFYEAIEKWNNALVLTPNNEKLYEMKAQVLMILEQDFSAVKCAELAVGCNKTWYVAWLTLGRAQMNLKDFAMAKKSFSRALHLQPSESDIRVQDLQPAVSLLKKIAVSCLIPKE